ncbi:Lysylphosphatidylglycerol synthase TM region [uncultured archaeon]|nr:Lysylphosphatidylglycerol synthase TM region [uncultured archaeon]
MKIKQFFPIIGIAIFVFLLIKLDVSKVIDEVLDMNLNFFIVALFLAIIVILMQTLKWFVIAKQQKINVPFLEAIKINLIGAFYGFITPAKVGNVIRASYLKKYSENNLGKGVGNFVLDKILDLCSLGFSVVIASFFFGKLVQISYVFSILLLLSFVILLGVIMSENWSRIIVQIINKIIGGFVPENLKNKIKEGFYSFHEDKPKKRYLLLFFLINMSTWIILYLTMFFVGLAIGIDVPFFYYLIILPVATLVAQIPITISGLGTREVTLIGLFGLLGVGATKVFSMALISLFLGDVIPDFFGFLFSFKKEKNV